MEQVFDGFYKNKKVLITGHTGFKGSWLCLLLKELGADVFGYSLSQKSEPNLFSEAQIESFVTSYIGDIRDFENLKNVINQTQPDIIIHMAAQALVKESYKNPRETYEVNIMGTVNLLEAVRSISSVKAIVNVTTDKCYENKEWYWGYRENDPLGGYDPYSNSKACSELVTSSFRNSFFNASDYSEHGLAIATARAGNVLGGGDWSSDRLIPDFFRAISSGQNVIIRSPYAIRPWQHVLEPLTGYLGLAKKLFIHGPSFSYAWNFGPSDDDSKNVEWIIKSICQLWGDEATYSIDDTPHPHEAHYLKLDCSKARSELEWSPKWNIEIALSSIVDWHKAYINNENILELMAHQIRDYFHE